MFTRLKRLVEPFHSQRGALSCGARFAAWRLDGCLETGCNANGDSRGGQSAAPRRIMDSPRSDDEDEPQGAAAEANDGPVVIFPVNFIGFTLPLLATLLGLAQ